MKQKQINLDAAEKEVSSMIKNINKMTANTALDNNYTNKSELGKLKKTVYELRRKLTVLRQVNEGK